MSQGAPLAPGRVTRRLRRGLWFVPAAGGHLAAAPSSSSAVVFKLAWTRERGRALEAMRLTLIGPAGSGKGTQADRIASHLRVPPIHAGALLRDQAADTTPVGRTTKGFLDRGDLVPDRLVIGMVLERIDQPTARTALCWRASRAGSARPRPSTVIWPRAAPTARPARSPIVDPRQRDALPEGAGCGNRTTMTGRLAW